jgi:phage/plasmid primase-like uncharacterized protein
MKTYVAQVFEHLSFLKGMGLEVHALHIGKFVRCHKIGRTQGRGDYAYHCNLNQMQQDRIGLITWCRGESGKEASFKTYGLPSDGSEIEVSYTSQQEIYQDGCEEYDEAIADKALTFWQNSSSVGSSCYLIRKGVGMHGIRFRASERYGNAAVVPMFDESGRLWSYQILNKDGSKRMMRGSCVKGLFHKLQDPIDGKSIGIAESYVTAATCLETSGIPTICCFSADNMPSVALSVRRLYPNSAIILFADNDRHLEDGGNDNKGVVMAKKAIAAVKENIHMIEPNFDDEKPSKEASDWNDLGRIKGWCEVRFQIVSFMTNRELVL